MNTENKREDFSSPLHKRSRIAYLLQCDFEYMVSLMVSDAFLAKLLTYLGLDDSTIGIISSIVSLAFAIQLFSILLSRRRVNSKTFSVVFNSLAQFLFLFLYLIPFLPLKNSAVKIAVMGIILAAYFSSYFVSNILYRWCNSFVDPHKRASYCAIKEIVSLLTGMAFTAIVGYIFDKCEESGNIEKGFVMIAVLIFINAVLNFICLLLVGKEKRDGAVRTEKSYSDIFRNTFGNRKFILILLFNILWNMAVYTTVGFLGTYKTKDLAFSVFAVQVINIVACLARALISRPLGTFSDKHSYAKGIEIGLVIAAAGFLCCTFASPSARWFIVAYTILYNASLAGIYQNSFNLAYSYIDNDYVTEALSIRSCIGGLCGFVMSLLAGKLLNRIQENGNVFWGLHVSAQQVLSVISFIFVFLAFLLVKFVIEKQKDLKQ